MHQFQIISKLGQGTFGGVFKVKRKSDNQFYALKKVKIANLKEKEKQNSLNQVRLLASLENPCIISYKDCFYDQRQQNLCLIMEFAQKGDLLQFIQKSLKNKERIPQQMIWRCLFHISIALKVLHDRKIMHRDIKSANIFMCSNGIFKLGDMNVSKVIKYQLVHTQTGTPYYASPEVWKNLPYDTKSDIWSFGNNYLIGCVLYQMASLRPPFTGNNMEQLYEKVKKCHFRRIPSKYSNQLFQIISSMLKLNPSLRPSSTDLINNPIILKQNCDQKQILIQMTKPYLLNTIKVPKNLKFLKQKLPKSNYITSVQSQQNEDNKKMKKKITLPPVFNKLDIKEKSVIYQKEQKLNRNVSANYISDELNLPIIINNDHSNIYKNNYHNQNKRIKEQKSVANNAVRYYLQKPTNIYNMDEKLFNTKPKVIEPLLMNIKQQLLNRKIKLLKNRYRQIYGINNDRIYLNQNLQYSKEYKELKNTPIPKIEYSRPIWWG